jgi:ADP-dependent NAD(P)H-hydrate dehydratase / NAD(P)H-hydrate epimerase
MDHDPMTVPIANRLYGEGGMRELDRRAMAQPGMGGGALMERAGAALLEALSDHFPVAGRLGVLCGPGNNGGDGFVLARHATAAGWSVTVYAGAAGAGADTDGGRARRAWTESGGAIEPLGAFSPDQAGIWADCLFGIGLRRPLEGPYAELAETLNRSGAKVLAADVPSGVDIDTGCVRGIAVRAWLTVTMIADKFGLHTGPAVDYAGMVRVAGLGVPEPLFDGVPWLATRVTPEQVPIGLPLRRPGAHKGDFGHLLVIGGAPGYSGAARLTAAAALRAGAGRVTLVTHPEHAALANIDRPELMVRSALTARDLGPLLAAADAVAVGPGLGQGGWGRALWLAAADWRGPLVVDADALNLLAQAPRWRDDWVLTPHPGEAGRLLGSKASAVNADRLAALRAIGERYGGAVLLKGAGTLVTAGLGERPACVTGGHPGMATAGMGDVLTGIVAALRAQGLGAGAAAATGAAWHIAAAQLAAQRLGGQRGMLAGDVVDALPSGGAGHRA